MAFCVGRQEPRKQRAMRSISSFLLLALITLSASGGPDGQPTASLKSESFDRDPGWEGHNNRIVPDRVPTITQNFGYTTTNFAGKATGELGGQVTRASEPAFYA